MIDKATKEANKKLVERFPFLIPRNVWSGKKITEGAGFWPGSPDEVPEYDYEYTLLDNMPEGWRKAFGEQMCEELKEALDKAEAVLAQSHTKDEIEKIKKWYGDWYPVQIKEKYGTLRIYSNWSTEDIDKILLKYERLSEVTCIECGAPATKYTIGWISPYCDKCASKYDTVITKEEYFNENFWES